MRLASSLIVFALAFSTCMAARAQVPVAASPDQQRMLASQDPALAANKRLVYDFWREVFEGGHLDLAAKYLAEDYIQHNPTVPTGRAGFVQFLGRFSKPQPIARRIKAPLVAIVAEGDLVVLSFTHVHPDPKDPSKHYTSTWFDMFRIQGHRIVEHWDPATRE